MRLATGQEPPGVITMHGFGYCCGLCGFRIKGFARENERAVEHHIASEHRVKPDRPVKPEEA